MSLGDNDIGNTGTMGVESFSVDILNSPTRNLSPSHERSRSRSYERRHRSRSSSQRRSRSPRNRNNRSRSRDRYRDRNRRSDNSRRNGNRSSVQQSQQLDRELGLKYRWEKTVYVSNIPYETRWTDLKDLFRDKVGDVMYCEVFEKDGRSLGVGAVEFKTESDAERAVKIMHQYDLGNRKISVRIDGEGFKTRQAKEQVLEDSRNKKSKNQPTDTALAIAKALSGGQGNLLGLLGMGGGGSASLMGNFGGASASLNPQQNMLNQLAAQLKVDGPVTNRIFVASLDYKVDEDKIKEVFSMAGRVQSCQMFRDRDGKSRGMAVVEYDTPMEALNAVSMFNQQVLNDRQMSVRFDTKPPSEDEKPKNLPSGLKSIGKGISLPSLGTDALIKTQARPDLSILGGLGININGTAPSLMSGLLGQVNNTNSSSLMGFSPNEGYSKNAINKVFVKNIPFTWDERKLKEKFRQAGHIENADIKMKDGKSRGFAIIRFSTPDQANKGVELFNGSRFEGRTLEVRLDKM